LSLCYISSHSATTSQHNDTKSMLQVITQLSTISEDCSRISFVGTPGKLELKLSTKLTSPAHIAPKISKHPSKWFYENMVINLMYRAKNRVNANYILFWQLKFNAHKVNYIVFTICLQLYHLRCATCTRLLVLKICIELVA